MKKIVIVTLSLCIPIVHAESTKTNPTAAQFAEQVSKQGSEKVINAIPEPVGDNYPSGEWAYIMDSIASGNPEWVKIVPDIMPAKNSRWDSDVSGALTKAIPNNAGGVMSVMNDNDFFRSTKIVCNMPIYIGPGSLAKLNDYFVKAVRALYRENSVQAQKCLVQLVTNVGQSESYKEIE